MPVPDEEILVLPAAVLQGLGPFEGFQPQIDRYLPAILDHPQLDFRPRAAMEQDPGYKQLIPYVVLQWDAAPGDCRLFTYTRGRGQGEARLHAKRSLGIGGHISREDAAGDGHAYHIGMQRELAEEVVLETDYREECVGLIYDPSTPVGQVHLGIVHRFRLAEPRVRANEQDLCEAGFVPLETLRAEFDSLETWSQLCLHHLFSDSD